MSPAPTSRTGWRQQQTRWEAGRWQAVRRYAPRLVGFGVRRRRAQPLLVGLDLLVPPQSAIATLNVVTATAALAAGNRRALLVSLTGIAAQITFVIGGLVWVGAPTSTYLALLRAPMLVARKLALYLEIGRGRTSEEWVRAERVR